ncbi:hypothetical protein HY947_01185 [Candidatus Gottesmanbacteria bacterium]|nr:hypothetical protein [Candidatus Gottesmanbacteria bacterium]
MKVILSEPLLSFCFGFLTYNFAHPMHLGLPWKIGFSLMIWIFGTIINKFHNDDPTTYPGESYGMQWCIMGPMIALLF